MGIKYSVDEHFFKKWNPVMAYLLGFIYADGCMYLSARGHYFALTSTDESIIEDAKRWLGSAHVIERHSSLWPKGKDIFKFMYNGTAKEFFFLRKYVIFEEYFALRPQRIDKEVQSILDY